MWILLVVGGVFLLTLIWGVATSNTIKQSRIKVEESASGIDVALTQRFDMLNSLLDATKGFIKHERETLEKIVKLRQPASNASIEEKQKFSNEVEKGLQAINLVVEQYPQLRSSETVSNLQKATVNVEENLQAARRIYNSNVSYFNRYIAAFPNSIIAGMIKANNLPFFEATAIKRENVKIEF